MRRCILKRDARMERMRSSFEVCDARRMLLPRYADAGSSTTLFARVAGYEREQCLAPAAVQHAAELVREGAVVFVFFRRRGIRTAKLCKPLC